MEFERFNFKDIDNVISKLNQLGTGLDFSRNLSVLGEKTEIKGKTIENRIVYQPMEGCDGTAGGSPDELAIRRYRRFAQGGPGLVWLEAVAIEQEGRANPKQLYMRKDNLDDFKFTVNMIKEECVKANGFEPVVIIQATHSGRYSRPNGISEPIIACNNPLFEKDAPLSKERIITDDGLRRLEEKMAAAAVLSEKAGFDGVDIKACHRYLCSELLSAYTREGPYGGSFENRIRFLMNCVDNAIASTGSQFIVTARINAYDGFPYPYGFGVKEGEGTDVNLDEVIGLVKLLRSKGMDMVNITMGNPYANPHVNRPYDAGDYIPPEHPLIGVCRMLNGVGELQKAVPEVKMVASGFSYLREYAPWVGAGLIEKKKAAYMGVGRLTFAYPGFASDVLKNGEADRKKVCLACGKCTQVMRAGGTAGCVIRDPAYVPIFKKYCGEA